MSTTTMRSHTHATRVFSGSRRLRRGLFLLATSGAISLGAETAHAQRVIPAQAGVLTPGRSLVGNDDASAVATNPANLGFLPAGELRWTWVNSFKDSPFITQRGHSFDLATPVFGPLSVGTRLDLVRPFKTGIGEAVNTPGQGTNGAVSPYEQITTAIALTPRKSISLGMSFTGTYSDDPQTRGLVGMNAGLTLRPGSFLGLAVLARNFNHDSNQAGSTLDRTVEVGAMVRPTRKRAIEVGLEVQYSEAKHDWAPRAVLGVDVPHVGRLRGDVIVPAGSSPTPGWMATVGLDVNFGGEQVFGGALLSAPNTGASAEGSGFFAGMAFRGYRENGFPMPSYAVRLRIESVPGSREHVRLLRALWRIADDPEVSAVAFVLKAEPASSLPHAEELGDAIRMLRSRGKKVLCHLEDGGGRALFMCSQADRIVINPAGGVRFSGLRSQYMYFGDLLKKVGVRADFVRVGAHKTAPEQYTNNTPTPTAEDDHKDLLRQLESTFLHDIGGGRRIAVDDLKERLAKGPFIAREATAAGLVDSYAYDDEIESVVREMVGQNVSLVAATSAPVFTRRPAEYAGERPRVAVIHVDGDIIDGRSRSVPIIGMKLVGGATIVEAIKAAKDDPLVRAIVLRVESPGGSSLASDIMWREISRAAAAKPLIVSMGSVAASGGYYVAAPGKKIFALRSTITGSIGIFFGKVDVEEALKKIGIGISTYRTAPHADLESLYRPFSDEEREELGKKIKVFYDQFVERVATGRGMSIDAVDAVARGRVWTGEQAKAAGLVDQIGGFREALIEARRLGGLPSDAPFSEGPDLPTTVLDTLLELAGIAREADPSATALLPAQILDLARALAPFAAYEPGTPLARLDAQIGLP